MTEPLVLNFTEVSKNDVGLVGGKNASLGELIRSLVPRGIVVPPGFATTARAFRLFLEHNDLDGAIAGLFTVAI